MGETLPCSPQRQQKAAPVVCRSSDASSHREHTSSCAESQKASPQALPLKAAIERMAVREHRTVCYGRGSGICPTRQLLIPDPDGVRTLPALQILVLPAGPRPPAPRREGALATHVEVTEGKHSQEKGQRLGFYSQSFQGGRLVLCCGWRPGGGVGAETQAEMDRLSGQYTHVADDKLLWIKIKPLSQTFSCMLQV